MPHFSLPSTIHRRRAVFVLGLLALVFFSACSVSLFGRLSNTSDDLPREVPEDLREVWEVWQILQTDYVAEERLDAATLSRGAIEGLLEALDDPYTHFVDQDQYEMQIADLEGTFEGIGAIVGMRDGQPIIVSPIRGTPAESAGLRSGDVIVAVDGESVEGLALSDVVDRIRGEAGTTVVLSITPIQSGTQREVSVVRGAITVPTVTVDVLDGEIAWIILASFTSQTDEDLRHELEGLDFDDISGIVLDLRNNPGGLVDTAVGVVDEFLDGGTIFYEVKRSNAETEFSASDDGAALDVSMVVLINAGSASASEIVSGALQAHGRATLIGETTFGKGSVTTLKELSTGSGFFVTSARWITPDRQPIEGIGLTPDVFVGDDLETEADEVLEQAIEILQSLDTID